MGAFRCLACGGEGTGAVPACAPCGLDAADPADADSFVALVAVHFDPPGRRPGRGRGHAACDRALALGRRPGLMLTGEPAAVTCPACRASRDYADANGTSNGVARLPIARLDHGA